uniref:OSJNBa0028M15.23 protein n=1 Tax=Oryza sativa subsp. japonica TaxID=39947 RepID=Q7XK64_ORYSJ|nr:OSJNBa0028M15.23 [Oryza sativa Japonica Group]
MTLVYKENEIELIKHWLSHQEEEGKTNFEEKKNEALSGNLTDAQLDQGHMVHRVYICSNMNTPLNMEKREKLNGSYNVDAVRINLPNLVLKINGNIQEGECCAPLDSMVKSHYHFKTSSLGKTEPQTKPYPLDMWKYGSALHQRPEDRSLYGRGATIKTMHPDPSLKPF